MNDNDLGTIVFLEHYGDLSYSEVEESLEHSGIKGMKWGVRNEAKRSGRQNGSKKFNGASKKESIKAIEGVNKNAASIIREARRAETPAARKYAADKYKKEVVDVVKSPGFKAKYNAANKMGKGEMALHVLLFGPFALLTIPAIKRVGENDNAYNRELDQAHDVLQKLRTYS